MRFFVIFVFFVLFWGFGSVSAQDNTYNIIPKPAKLTPMDGQFVFSSETRIVAPIREPDVFNAVFVLLERLLHTTQFNTQIVDNTNGDIAPDKNMIFCRINPDMAGKEAYRMRIDRESIEIEAGSATGIFYAMQTLRQLLPAAVERNRPAGDVAIAVPCAIIEDEPSYPFRGLMLDVARHFASESSLRRYIDVLAYHKINYFHWHLTNDQGWRIAIDIYPDLTQTGAWRDSTLIGVQTDDEAERTYRKQRYGGFYTKEQVRNIVAYAQRRFVTIIPEISMPGHSLAALAAYPELSCTGGEHAVASHWGKFDDVLCTKEETFEFVENVITELIELFPGDYIHIGADEFSKLRWENCEQCRKKIEELGLENEHELKDYFIARVGNIVASKDKHLLVRDDIPSLNFAFCQTQSREREPLCADGYLPLVEVYAFDPETEQIAEAQDISLTGAQANLWREYISSDMQTEAMILPRLSALAETLWTPADEQNYDDFLLRLAEILKRYDAMNIISSSP